MKLQTTGKPWRWMTVGVVGLFLCPAVSAKDAFPLAGAVPGDVFFCDVGHHNPERDFLEQYWGEVFAAFGESGITADLWSLLGSQLDDESQAEVDRFKEMGLKLFESVEWGKLGAKGHACAMRMPKLRVTEHEVIAGGPDMIAILRSTEEDAAKNYAGLVAILDTIVSEVAKAAETDLIAVKKSTRFGAEVASLYPPEGMNGPIYGLALALKGDLILVAVGGSIIDDSLALLAGKSEIKPLSANARFKAAFKGLPAPEGGKTFFDMQTLIKGIEQITTGIFAYVESDAHGPKDVYLNTMRSEEIRSLNTKAVNVYRAGDSTKALALVTEAHAKDPTDSMILYNLCCFEALAGNQDKALDWLGQSVKAGFYAPNKIKQDSDLDTLREDARYQTALAEATAQAAEHAADNKGKRGPDAPAIAKLILGRVLDLMGMMDYSAAVRYTDGYTTYQESIVVMSDDAPGHPLYNAFVKRPPLTEFERFLPQETESFSLSGSADLVAFYDYLEDTVRACGPEAEALLVQWAGIQEQAGFDVKKDLLSWINGEFVSVGFKHNGTDAGVMLMKVNDETAAREKIEAGLAWVAEMMPKLTAQNPMLAMIGLRTTPTTHPKLEGFTNVFIGMQPTPVVLGVRDGYVMGGSSADAVALCLDTAAGKHPNIRKNDRVMAEALVPDGACSAVSFTDLRTLGQNLAMATGMFSMIGGMAAMAVPPDIQPTVAKVMGIIAKLGPVVAKIDFYKSTATLARFDGKTWHVKYATNYASPAERAGGAD